MSARKKKAPKRVPRAAAPPPGSVIEKTFKGKTIRVEVTDTGFRHAGKDWPSLTALALHLTGYKAVSGPAFFGLTKRPDTAPRAKGRSPAKAKQPRTRKEQA